MVSDQRRRNPFGKAPHLSYVGVVDGELLLRSLAENRGKLLAASNFPTRLPLREERAIKGLVGDKLVFGQRIQLDEA